MTKVHGHINECLNFAVGPCVFEAKVCERRLLACFVHPLFVLELTVYWVQHALSTAISSFRLCKQRMPRSPDERKASRSVSRSRSRSPVEEKRKRRRSNTYSRSRSPSPNTSKRLHIANLDDSVRRRDIEDAFGKFGKLEDIWLASYPPLYGFVVFEEAKDAAVALKEMKTAYVRNCKIHTSVALPRNSGRRGPPPRNDRNDRNDRRYERRRTPERSYRPSYRNNNRRSRSPDERRRRRSRS
ncbi:RNA recognition motif domain and Nucleotide-binding, alpha-beta plait domain-containing protein [Aphelenchoides bicaudatus]|nr:RNA recognition motif domain and Nucleotide-binding, alpha-beta plait domain-containing protein [Aphelenchoides bicaudatus]